MAASTASAAPAADNPTAADAAKPADVGDGDFIPGSGAFVERGIVEGVDPKHPAIDDNPRAGTTAAQNQRDMNDPTLPGHVQAARALGLPDDYDADKAAKKP